MTAFAGRTASQARWGAGLLLGALFLVSLCVGVGDLRPAAFFSDPEALRLLLASRLPRTLAALLTGAGLAIAGLIMQTLARNRFVEPATAGTAQSAALGILLVTILCPAAALPVKTLAATVAALAGTSLFLMTAHRLRRRSRISCRFSGSSMAVSSARW